MKTLGINLLQKFTFIGFLCSVSLFDSIVRINRSSEMEGSVMGSKRLTPTTVEKMASKCLLLLLLLLLLFGLITQIVLDYFSHFLGMYSIGA